jgi:hypothetical protein
MCCARAKVSIMIIGAPQCRQTKVGCADRSPAQSLRGSAGRWGVGWCNSSRAVAMSSLRLALASERSAIGDQVLNAAEVFTTIATLRDPIAQSLRNHVAPILTSFQFVRDKVRRNWSEISINYRHGPLGSQQWPSLTSGLATGDRLGDAPLASALDGHASTLLQTLDGKRHSLLLLPGNDGESLSRLIRIAEETNQAFPGILAAHLILKPETSNLPTASSDLPVWLDTEARAHEQLGANEATLILVRPDGYTYASAASPASHSRGSPSAQMCAKAI